MNSLMLIPMNRKKSVLKRYCLIYYNFRRPHQPPHEYPENKITQIIQNNNFPLAGFFEKQEEEAPLATFSIDTKISFFDGAQNICEERTEYIYPRWGENLNGKLCF